MEPQSDININQGEFISSAKGGSIIINNIYNIYNSNLTYVTEEAIIVNNTNDFNLLMKKTNRGRKKAKEQPQPIPKPQSVEEVVIDIPVKGNYFCNLIVKSKRGRKPKVRPEVMEEEKLLVENNDNEINN
jgi:hypothetical protein